MNKKILGCALVLGAVASLCSCERVYVQESSTQGADYNNMVKTLTLVDAENYTLNVTSYDSKDSTRVTMELNVTGTYVKEDKIVTLETYTGTCNAVGYGEFPVSNANPTMMFMALSSLTLELSGSTFTEVVSE